MTDEEKQIANYTDLTIHYTDTDFRNEWSLWSDPVSEESEAVYLGSVYNEDIAERFVTCVNAMAGIKDSNAMSTDMQTPEVGNAEKDGLLQQWIERAVKAERNADYWQHYASEKLKTYYEMRLSQEIERAQKDREEIKRLRELLANSASLLGEFNSDFANGQISIHRWQRQYDGAKQRESVKENGLTEGKE